MSSPFPLNGIIGIVGSGAHEIDLALEFGLSCIEVRSDLLMQNGLSADDIVSIIRQAKAKGINSLLTHRRRDHGGIFDGPESFRMDFYAKAAASGVDIIDAELNTETADFLLEQGLPTLLSHHDFNGMPDENALAGLTSAMLSRNPAAIKIVPTASCPDDAMRMLKWVGQAGEGPKRIGFAMGGSGAFSRILALAFGSPVTYASFGKPVAPGQISLAAMKNTYRVEEINSAADMVGMLGDDAAQVEDWVNELNRIAEKSGVRLIGLPLEISDASELDSVMESISLKKLIVGSTIDDNLFNQDSNSDPGNPLVLAHQDETWARIGEGIAGLF